MSKSNLSTLAFIGVDTHKEKHVAVLSNCWHQPLATLEILNDPESFHGPVDQILKKSQELNLIPVFGLEDSKGLGLSFAKYLIKRDLLVKDVNPVRSDRERDRNPHPEKSDPQDGFAIARVLIDKFDELPTIKELDETTLAIKELCAYRDKLVKHQTSLKNQLHNYLHKEYPDYKKMFPSTFGKGALAFWQNFPTQSCLAGTPIAKLANFLRKNSHNTISTKKAGKILGLINPNVELSPLSQHRASLIQSLARQLISLQHEIQPLEQKLAELVEQTGIKLHTMDGADIVTAAKLIGYVGNINAFASSDKLARCFGIAPVKDSSGKKVRYVKDKHGNRKAYSAIYQIALNQIGKTRNGKLKNEIARAYYERKISEGKSKKEALTCLCRRLCDIIYAMMKNKTEYHKPVPKNT